MLQTKGEVIGRHDMSDIGCTIGSYDTHTTGENNQDGHDGEQTENLWQDEIAGGVDAHNLQGINLLGDTHSTYL